MHLQVAWNHRWEDVRWWKTSQVFCVQVASSCCWLRVLPAKSLLLISLLAFLWLLDGKCFWVLLMLFFVSELTGGWTPQSCLLRFLQTYYAKSRQNLNCNMLPEKSTLVQTKNCIKLKREIESDLESTTQASVFVQMSVQVLLVHVLNARGCGKCFFENHDRNLFYAGLSLSEPLQMLLWPKKAMR